MSRYLQQKISAIRVKHVAVAAGTGLTMAAACFVGIVTVEVLVDWYLDLPMGWRWGILLANVAAALYCLVRYTVMPIARSADDETLALAVERMEPAFSSRLIAAIQFSREGALAAGESSVLVRAMVRQTEQFAAAIDFRAVVRAGFLARCAGIAAAVFLAAAGLYAYGGENSPVMLRRAFLQNLPLPQKTHVAVLRGSFLVATGERVELAARARGTQPDAGTAEITFASGRKQTLALQIDPDEPGVYMGAIEAVPESFTYRIRLNDGVSETFAVAAEDRPVVESLTCTQIYPAYTGLPETPRQPTDLLLLAGSKLRLTVRTNKPLAPNVPGQLPDNLIVRQNQKETGAIPSLPLVVDPADPRRWTAEITLPGNIAGFSIHLLDQVGLESKNPPFYPVDLLPDHPPTVRITAPDRREMLVTQEATASVGFIAEDDFGLAAVALHYKINDDAEKVVPLDIHVGDRQVKGYYPWVISKLVTGDRPSLEGCVIEFYVQAKDGNDVTGPGITDSEHYQLRVVSKSDKQAELIARMAESFSTIHDVSDNQENAAAELGAIITEQRPVETRP